MPPTETPPDPLHTITPVPPPPDPSQPTRLKVRAGRFGELEEHELLHLLDAIDDERSRSRFRESVYISVFVYLALAWFVFYGPRLLFHQGKVILPADAMKQHEKELTLLNLPQDLAKLTPKNPKIGEKPAPAPAQRPTLDRKTLEQLQAMRRTEPPKSNPEPLPSAPQPQPVQPAPPPPPPPAAPTPQPQIRPAPAAVPDAPRPNFNTPNSASQSMRDLAANAGRVRGSSGAGAVGAPVGHSGAGASSQAEILSDTLGVDFGPYIKRLLVMIRNSWIPLIPEEVEPPLNKEGTTLIRFRIEPNGKLSYMHLDDSTHDAAIDRAAWGSITSQGQFPPLPPEFKGPNLDLRIQFVITHNLAEPR